MPCVCVTLQTCRRDRRQHAAKVTGHRGGGGQAEKRETSDLFCLSASQRSGGAGRLSIELRSVSSGRRV